jgi:membrane protein DedA with SNARE-associated domain
MNLGLLAGLAAGTFVSEDLTSISAGLLARDGAVDLPAAIAACAAGVYVGDLGLWGLGRVCGRRLLEREWMARRIDPAMVPGLGARLDDHLGLAVFASRFLPGSRLPMYLAIGVSGRRPAAFAAWSLLAVLLWTPALVWLTRTFGASLAMLIVGELSGALRYLLAAVLLCAVWRLTVRIVSGGLASRI